MTIAKRAIVAAGVWLLAAAGTLDAQSADQVFQQALRAERVEGNLESAIALYRQVVDLGDRPLAARALLRMAESYERLGRDGAEEAYRRLVAEFGDQTAAVETARSRLAELAPLPQTADTPTQEDGLSLRLVWGGSPDNEGRTTPDGRLFTYTDWAGGWDLAARDVVTGTSRTLAKGERGRDYPLNSSVSNDGRRVAYLWNVAHWQPQLRTVSIEGGEHTILLENASGELDYIIAHDWTPDDSEILTTLLWLDGHSSVALVSVTDGTIRNVRSLEDRSISHAALSPDGRWIVYDIEDRNEDVQSEVMIVAADGSSERALTSHPASDQEPTFTPDGRHVIFSSDRGGSVDLWAVPVYEGSPSGSPFLVTRDIGEDFRAMNFTEDGAFVFGRDVAAGDIYSVEFDAAKGTVAGTPRLEVPVYQGYNTAPSWSQDGRLAYLSRRRQAGDQTARLIVRDPVTGEEIEPAPSVRFHRQVGNPEISSDGTLVAGAGLPGPGIHLVDVATGEIRELDHPRPASQAVSISRDGRTVYYAARLPAEDAPPDNPEGRWSFQGLIRHDVETDTWQPYFAWDLDFTGGANQPGSWAISPDETKVAFLMGLDPRAPFDAGAGWAMYVGDLESGVTTEITRVDRHDGCRLVGGRSRPAWTNDGSRILYVCAREDLGDRTARELMSVPATGGVPESTGLRMERLRWISVRADGSIGFAAGPNKKLEVWAMSGLLESILATDERR